MQRLMYTVMSETWRVSCQSRSMTVTRSCFTSFKYHDTWTGRPNNGCGARHDVRHWCATLQAQVNFLALTEMTGRFRRLSQFRPTDVSMAISTATLNPSVFRTALETQAVSDPHKGEVHVDAPTPKSNQHQSDSQKPRHFQHPCKTKVICTTPKQTKPFNRHTKDMFFSGRAHKSNTFRCLH